VKTDKAGTLQELERACEELGFTSKQGSPGMVSVRSWASPANRAVRAW